MRPAADYRIVRKERLMRKRFPVFIANSAKICGIDFLWPLCYDYIN